MAYNRALHLHHRQPEAERCFCADPCCVVLALLCRSVHNVMVVASDSGPCWPVHDAGQPGLTGHPDTSKAKVEILICHCWAQSINNATSRTGHMMLQMSAA
jgi:hypothetical protein